MDKKTNLIKPKPKFTRNQLKKSCANLEGKNSKLNLLNTNMEFTNAIVYGTSCSSFVDFAHQFLPVNIFEEVLSIFYAYLFSYKKSSFIEFSMIFIKVILTCNLI
ncbi:hypothetical protein RF11_00633 [Thelohanellus kitauei]|uniref:Uncharacterized protein n=1 Tax=Thelohanellus kitauei TaxID=669202 RepID=A0A0C2I9A2_THEKT|nr:hypothetical protein RF11_00633 [Thelohanellus kitauei]